MNNQEIFNKVYVHLLTQMEKSVDENGMCSYRGKNGLKCAVGALIPDNEYVSGIENTAACYIVNYVPSLSGVDRSFLQNLQDIHDGNPPIDWEEKLESLASAFDLTIPAMPKASTEEDKFAACMAL